MVMVFAPNPFTFSVGVVVVFARLGSTAIIVPVASEVNAGENVAVITLTEPAPATNGMPAWGRLKLKVAAELEPLLVTVGEPFGGSSVTLPAAIVAAAPALPVDPVDPVGPVGPVGPVLPVAPACAHRFQFEASAAKFTALEVKLVDDS